MYTKFTKAKEVLFLTNKEVFDLVAEVGVLMLSGSGEIGRSQDTLEALAKGFGIKDFKCYLLSNGLFLSGMMEDEKVEVRIDEVPVKGTNLYEVENLNRLSRRVLSEGLTPEEAKKEVDRIKTTSPYSFLFTAMASGIGCAAFCYFFKGTWADTFATVPIGILLWCFYDVLAEVYRQPKIICNLFTSMFLTFCACICCHLGWADNVDKVIIGAIMPLVPGVPFVNSIRNFFSDDYLSGVVRMADALLTALSVGVGVGVSIIIWNTVIGGVALW